MEYYSSNNPLPQIKKMGVRRGGYSALRCHGPDGKPVTWATSFIIIVET